MPPAASADQSLSYSYFELRGDISTTANDARGARDDANGRLVGLTANWEFRESWYAKAGYSLERKSFSNEVAGNVLSLDTRQAAATLGGGRFWHAGEKTDIYVEALVVHIRTDHDVPDVAVMQGGPPSEDANALATTQVHLPTIACRVPGAHRGSRAPGAHAEGRRLADPGVPQRLPPPRAQAGGPTLPWS